MGRPSVIPPLLPSNEAPCAGGENAPRSATLGPFPYPDSRLGRGSSWVPTEQSLRHWRRLLGRGVVAGSANNQLAQREDAARLHERGILYAPDFIVNAGGIIQLFLLEDRGASEEEMQRHLHAVGDTLRDLFARGGDPADAADALAAERIAQKRDEALA